MLHDLLRGGWVLILLSLALISCETEPEPTTGDDIDRFVMPVVHVDLAHSVVDVAIAMETTCALLQNGEVWCWGDNRFYGVGVTEPTAVSTPQRVPGLPDGIVSLDARVAFGPFTPRYGRAFLALDGEGTIHVWGDVAPHAVESLLHRDFAPVPSPMPLSWFESPARMVVGGGPLIGAAQLGSPLGCALFEDDARPICFSLLYYPDYAQDNPDPDPDMPAWRDDHLILLTILDGPADDLDGPVDDLDAGVDIACARNAVETFCYAGLMAIGEDEDDPVDEDYQGMPATAHQPGSMWAGQATIRRSLWASCVMLLPSGFPPVRCWFDNWDLDSNRYGFLPPHVPEEPGLNPGEVATWPVIDLALGPGDNACLVTDDGHVLCWGDNYFMQDRWVSCDFMSEELPHGVACMGDRVDICLEQGADRSECSVGDPVSIPGLDEPIRKVAVGAAHMCGVTETGRLRCWGRATWGRLGDGRPVENPVWPHECAPSDEWARAEHWPEAWSFLDGWAPHPWCDDNL